MAIVVDEEEKRHAISDAAFELFVSKGYRATTTREICGAAGISKGTLYHYFRNKEDLLSYIVGRLWEADMRELGEISAHLASRQETIDFLPAWFVSHFPEFDRQITLIADFAINRDRAVVEAMLTDRMQTRIRLHSQVLTAHPGQRPSGPPTPVAADDVAILRECMGEGLILLSHVLPHLDIGRYIRLFWRLMNEHLEQG